MAADRTVSFSMFVEMANIATKPSSRDDGLLSRLSISPPLTHCIFYENIVIEAISSFVVLNVIYFMLNIQII